MSGYNELPNGRRTVADSYGTILLHVRIGELRVRAWLGMIDNLAVELLLGTTSMNWYIGPVFSDGKSEPSRTEHL